MIKKSCFSFLLIWMSTTHPLHIIFVEVAATMATSPFIKLWKIFHPTACWILAHCCLSIHSPRQNEHFRQLNGTSKPEIETAYYNIPIVNRKNYLNCQVMSLRWEMMDENLPCVILWIKWSYGGAILVDNLSCIFAVRTTNQEDIPIRVYPAWVVRTHLHQIVRQCCPWSILKCYAVPMIATATGIISTCSKVRLSVGISRLWLWHLR